MKEGNEDVKETVLDEKAMKEYERIRKLIGPVRERKMTKEERRKAAEEFAGEDNSGIFRKLGLA